MVVAIILLLSWPQREVGLAPVQEHKCCKRQPSGSACHPQGYHPCLPCQSSPCCIWSSSGICVPWQACPIRGQVWPCWSSRAELANTAEMWSMWHKDETSLCQMQRWPTRQVLPAVPCSVKPQKVSLALYQTWLWLSNAGITPDNFTADNLKENTDSVICL